MSGFVYLWFDRKHHRYYIGSHWGAEDDGYICSSSWMKQAYKHRPEDFKRRIISRVESSRANLLIEEQRWLAMIKPEEVRVRYYNLRLRTDYHWLMSEDRKLSVSEKISKTLTGRKNGPHKQETREKMSKASKGRSKSDQHRSNLSKALKGKPLTENQLAERRTRKASEEKRAKTAASMRAYWQRRKSA